MVGELTYSKFESARIELNPCLSYIVSDDTLDFDPRDGTWSLDPNWSLILKVFDRYFLIAFSL